MADGWQDQCRTATLNTVGPSVRYIPVQRCWAFSLYPVERPPPIPHRGWLQRQQAVHANESLNTQTL